MEQQFEQEIDLREIVLVLLKRKWLIIGLFVAAVIISAVASSFMTPVYKVTAKLELGNYGDATYTNPARAVEILKSADVLGKIADKLNLERTGLELKEDLNITVAKGTNILNFSIDTTGDGEILNELMRTYQQMEQEELEEAREEIRDEIQLIEREMQTVRGTISKAEETVARLGEDEKLSNLEKLFVQTSIYDQIRSNQAILRDLENRKRKLERNLADLRGSQVIETATVSEHPYKPNKMLNVAIAAVLGLMAGVFLAFTLEFFEKNPLSEYEQKSI
ncbi:MAG: hypothetical protein H0Z35_10350 [Thermoanaerobacteraceae bacterium]|nr:hypothetical protein [Thermoanaerobacteraceae bacterium]